MVRTENGAICPNADHVSEASCCLLGEVQTLVPFFPSTQATLGLSPPSTQIPLQALCSCMPSSGNNLEATFDEIAHTVFAQTER